MSDNKLFDMCHLSYLAFVHDYDTSTRYKGLRFGQAFYNFAKLDKMQRTGFTENGNIVEPLEFVQVYNEPDRKKAEALIASFVNFN